jgi:inner membrane protein
LNPITHALTGWCLAEAVPRLTTRQRGIVVIACIAPDIDGVGIVPEFLTRNGPRPLLWWSEYHHLLAHNLGFACLVAAVAGLAARTNRALTALLAFVAVHLHFLEDIVGSRGPDGYEWPIPYLYPSRFPELSWSGQWALNAWQNIAITVVLLGITFILAWYRGYSPVGLISSRADRAFVATLRNRFRRATIDERDT